MNFQQTSNLIKQYFRTHSVLMVISQFLHLGTSSIATGIIGSSVQYKAYKILKRRYAYILNNKNLHKIEHNDAFDNYENVIWFFWYQGLDNAPSLVKICHDSIVKNLSSKKTIIIDKDNFTNYVNIPKYILEKFEAKKFSITHFSDILRIALLARYGGTWIDATVLCTGNEKLNQFMNSQFFVFRSLPPGNSASCNFVSSWFISAKPSSKIIQQTYQLLLEYWKKEDSLLDYYLLHLFLCISIENNPEEWKFCKVSSNGYPHLLQFMFKEKFNCEKWNEIKNLTDVHKLANKFKKEDIIRKSYMDVFFNQSL